MPILKLVVVVTVLCVLGIPKDATRYCPPEFWTNVKVSKCKQVATDKMHCEADITFAGYTVKKPRSDTADVNRWKFELEQ